MIAARIIGILLIWIAWEFEYIIQAAPVLTMILCWFAPITGVFTAFLVWLGGGVCAPWGGGAYALSVISFALETTFLQGGYGRTRIMQ